VIESEHLPTGDNYSQLGHACELGYLGPSKSRHAYRPSSVQLQK
jgi:hypothetical protein